jgi:2-polyprenyl-3-methyl-5-hydroxy-6-metoxy-1,4-benzoquinol methylase
MSLTESGLCNKDFDVVCCLNVLDRCDDPWKLMEELKNCCKPNGLIVLAIVIPFCPVVMTSNGQKTPSNTFKGIPGCNDKNKHRFERCINAFEEKVFL